MISDSLLATALEDNQINVVSLKGDSVVDLSTVVSILTKIHHRNSLLVQMSFLYILSHLVSLDDPHGTNALVAQILLANAWGPGTESRTFLLFL